MERNRSLGGGRRGTGPTAGSGLTGRTGRLLGRCLDTLILSYLFPLTPVSSYFQTPEEEDGQQRVPERSTGRHLRFSLATNALEKNKIWLFRFTGVLPEVLPAAFLSRWGLFPRGAGMEMPSPPGRSVPALCRGYF